MWLSAKWLVLWSLWAARLVRQPTAPVRVSGGLLRGAIAPDGSHAQYFGIPYATVKPEDRFRGSSAEPKWEGMLDAANEHIRCKQRFTATMILGEEDCLKLNVYTPIQKTDQLRPVMVFIHGGGFRDGSGTPYVYGPEYLVRHGVILVTFNYRLEILGFLCLGIKEAPGNAGMKDQVEALRWVKRNIKMFGGDPDNITIFGESAGSASVLYHMVSPITKGLFQKAIMQSGSAISPWSLQFEPVKTARLLAQQMGYNIEDPYKIYKVFANKSAEELLTVRVPRTDGDIVLSENIFVPCVDKEIPEVERFLPDTPYNLITKGIYHKVPVIIGHNNAEGYMFAGKENDTMISKLNFLKALPRDLLFSSQNERKTTAMKLKELYMGDDEITKEKLAKFARYEGDSSITYPVISTIDLLTKTSNKPIYAYRLCYDGWLNLAKFIYGFMKHPGATHADELFYMFKVKVKLPLVFFETEFINRISSMWTNFAKYGNPTPEVTSLHPSKWEQIRNKDPRLFTIDKTCAMTPMWDDEIIRYWNSTYSKYRRKS